LLRLGGGLAIGFALSAPVLILFKEYLPLSFNTHNVGSGRHTDHADLFLNWLSPNISPTSSSIFSNSRNWVGAGAALLAACALVSRRSMKRHVGWSFVLMGSALALQIYGGGIVSPTRHLPLWSQANWPEFGTPIIALAVAVLAGIGVQSLATGELTRARFVVALGGLAAVTLWFVVITDRDLALSVADLGRRSWGTAALVILVITTSILVMRRGWAAWVTVAVIVLELLILAPRGIYAPRDDPYPKRDWIDFLVANTGPGGQRVFSTDGILFPDTAGVYGLSDPRMIDALYVDRYWKYVSTFISKGRYDRFIATGPTESAPNVAANPMFDLLGIRYVLYRTSLGTKPPAWSDPQYRLVFKSGDVAVFENRSALPRAFVVHKVRRVSSSEAALAYFTKGEIRDFPDGSYHVRHKDPGMQAVIEAKPHSAPETRSCAADASSEAQIADYSSDRVVISVNAACPGLLVLSDMYYPGWNATVNGHGAPLYPTDYALRGVPVPAGKSIVVMRYQPGTFKAGILILIVALLVLTAVAFNVLMRTTWWSSKTAQVRERREQMHGMGSPD
jgi:hypothetical protein